MLLQIGKHTYHFLFGAILNQSLLSIKEFIELIRLKHSFVKSIKNNKRHAGLLL